MFHWIIFLLLIVSSLSCNFNRCAICFQSFMNIAWRSTQNATRIKCFWRLRIVHKINIMSRLSRWSVTLLMFIQTLSSHCKFGASQSENRLAVIGAFANFFNRFAKIPRVLPSSGILNECNLYCKIVNYCILSEVCVIKTALHNTVSPQMWCI